MTYIVDQKVIQGAVDRDTVKGTLAMGLNTPTSHESFAAFLRLIGEEGDSLKVQSENLEQLLGEIVGLLRVMKTHLQLGSGLDIEPSDVEDT